MAADTRPNTRPGDRGHLADVRTSWSSHWWLRPSWPRSAPGLFTAAAHLYSA